MKILFYGDSITDMGRDRSGNDTALSAYGRGYVYQTCSELFSRDPLGYSFYNRGISGNRVVDLYARIKCDFWNYEPDVASIFIGINDIWHEFNNKNGVEPDRFEKVYRMLIEDTLARLPSLKLMLIAPFVLKGTATEENYEEFRTSTELYAQIVEKLAREYGLSFVPLQQELDAAALKYGVDAIAPDGVHPAMYGGYLISKAWLRAFDAL